MPKERLRKRPENTPRLILDIKTAYKNYKSKNRNNKKI